MTKALRMLLAALTICIVANVAVAQEDAGPPAPPQAVELEHDGHEGVWMPLEMSQQVLADAQELRERHLQIEDLKLQLSIKDDRIEAVKEALAYEKQAGDKALEAVELAEESRLRAEERLNKWYRHPVLWFTVGAVVIVFAEIGTYKLLQAATD